MREISARREISANYFNAIQTPNGFENRKILCHDLKIFTIFLWKKEPIYVREQNSKRPLFVQYNFVTH